MEKITENKKKILIAVMAYLNLTALAYTCGLSGDEGIYTGTGIFSFMPESLMAFALCAILLGRFLRKEIFSDRARVVTSFIFGMLLGFCTVWSQYILYSITLFDSASKVLAALITGLGISFFTIPLTSEIIGLADRCSGMLSDGDAPSGLRRRLLYLAGIWALVMISYVPLFLYVWPMNFFGDSWDELLSQINGVRTTHHTVIHGLMLRKFYLLGIRLGDPSYGIQFMTLLQMGLMAFAIARLSLYLYDKGVGKKIRIALFLVSILNPVNAYYAVTAEKGTMGVALAMIALVSLMKILDTEKAGKGFKNRQSVCEIMIFILSASLGCLFRNNMIYAFLPGGILIALLRKKGTAKLLMLLIVALLFGSFKAEEAVLMHAEGSVTTDRYRETFPLPIMCLTRVAILHGEEMSPEELGAIQEFIPQQAMDHYIISFSDDVKARANEGLLEEETGRFIGLFIKYGLKYPGDYLDQLAWLTYGYWNPFRAFTLGSTTPHIVKPLPEGYTDVRNHDLVPFMDGLFDFVYNDTGRFKLPLLAWCYRGTVYFWAVILLFIYGIARRNRDMVSMSTVPLFYLVTVFAGPLCQFRYMYFNVLTLPLILYCLMCRGGNLSDRS